IVVEDAKGNFVLQSDPTTTATPVWDAGSGLQGGTGAATFGPCSSGASPPSCRNVWTAVSDGSGGWTTIPFVDTDTARIGPALGLTDAICAQIQTKMTNPPATGSWSG